MYRRDWQDMGSVQKSTTIKGLIDPFSLALLDPDQDHENAIELLHHLVSPIAANIPATLMARRRFWQTVIVPGELSAASDFRLTLPPQVRDEVNNLLLTLTVTVGELQRPGFRLGEMVSRALNACPSLRRFVAEVKVEGSGSEEVKPHVREFVATMLRNGELIDCGYASPETADNFVDGVIACVRDRSMSWRQWEAAQTEIGEGGFSGHKLLELEGLVREFGMGFWFDIDL